MPNIVRITTENPDELLNTGAYGSGALIRVQSSATETGTYADLTGSGSTPTIPIVTLVRAYTAYDPNGTSSTWYRTRYENSGGTRLSDWSTAFQVGDETAGLLCSLYDVKQEIGNVAPDGSEDETILEKIRQVSVAIERMTGRWFTPRPLSGTATYTVHTLARQKIRFSRGIRSITSLGIANANQPPTGGTYSTALTTDYWLDPADLDRDPGWPATAVVLAPRALYPTVSATWGATITGQFGWASVPADIQGVAVRAVVRRYIGKSAGGASIAIGPAGTEFLLPDMSGSDRETLDSYRAVAF